MKVRELIAKLQEEDPEAHVIMSKDSEGNGYHPLDNDCLTKGSVQDINKYYLEVGPFDKTEAAKGGWDEDDVYDTKVVIIYP